MKQLYGIIFLLCLVFDTTAQVKSNYLYSTSMPYGTLDIRTNISSTNYFYIQENRTFSYRESSPGVRTNSYVDMTSTWDSSPYKQGNLRQKNGSTDKFIMNYRLLFPNNYSATYAEGYPLIIMFHGAVERGNCYYNTCYHSGWTYDPNVNSPKAPTASTHKLLNNDHNLAQGGKTHLDARNLAGTKLPNDPTLAARAFPGFVLVPQMFNEWEPMSVQNAIRLVQLVARKYNIDDNRIYVHGLSIGGYAVYESLKRASWLFAAALPMSASKDADIATHSQQGKMAHIPFWIFQGGKDTAPSPAYTNNVMTYLKNAGAVIRYSQYADVGHTVWHKAFAEPEFFKWMLSKSKANIHPFKGITTIVTSRAQYPKLMMAEGFHAYQWEKDGVIISGATTNTYIAKSPGKYRARFSRVPAPTSTQWNKWSLAVQVTVSTSTTAREATAEALVDEELSVPEFEMSVYPNPTIGGNIQLTLATPDLDQPVNIRLVDAMGRAVIDAAYVPDELSQGVTITMPGSASRGVFVIMATQGRRTTRQRLLIE